MHPTCKTSYNLIKKLYNEEELLKKTIIIDVASKPFYAIAMGVLSVPIIILKNDPLYAGPIDAEKAIRLLKEPSRLPSQNGSIKELAEKIPLIIGDSQALSSILVYNGLEAVLGYKNTIKAGLGVRDNHTVDNAIEEFIKNKELVEKAYRKAVRNLAYNTIRLLYWTYCNRMKHVRDFEEFLSLDHLALLLETSAIYGRIGLIHYRRKHVVEKTRPVYEYIRNRFDKILEYVVSEQEEIIGDEEYLKILEDKGVRVDYLRDFKSSCMGRE